MATNTTNLNLVKPDGSDNIKISDINGNMDIIDAAFRDMNENIIELEDNTYSLSSWCTVWAEGVDMDTVLTPGIYSAPTNAIAAECTNLPDGYTASGQALKLVVEYTSTVNFLRQTLIGRTGAVYSRVYNVSSTTWSSWERYITSSEFATLEARVAALEGTA